MRACENIIPYSYITRQAIVVKSERGGIPRAALQVARFAVDSTHGVTIARPQYTAARIVNQNDASAVVLGTRRSDAPPNRVASTSFMPLIEMICVGKRDDESFATSAAQH